MDRKWTRSSCWIVLACAAVLAGSPAFAQNDAPASQASAESPLPRTTGVWTGRLATDQPGKFENAPPEMKSTRAIRDELARVRATAQVDRDFDKALDALAVLAMRASAAPLEERPMLLADVALARIETYELAGDTAKARDAATLLLDDPRHTLARFEIALGTEQDRAAYAKAFEDPRLVAARAKYESRIQGKLPVDEVLESTIEDALTRGKFGLVVDLGPRTIPHLEALARSRPNEWMELASDPLYALTLLDEARAARLVLELFDSGPLWKRRVVRTMGAANVLANGGTFVAQNGRPPLLAETFWRDVVLRMLRDPETTSSATPFVRQLVMEDALDDALVQALVDAARTRPTPLASSAWKSALGVEGDQATRRRVLEGWMKADDDDVRAFAANELVAFGPLTDLEGACKDRSQQVRVAAAQSLRITPRPIWSYGVDHGARPNGTSATTFTIGPRERAAIDRLLGDEDAVVRSEALAVAIADKLTLDSETATRLAGDSDPRVRVGIAKDELLEPAVAAAVLTRLANDSNADVLHAVDARLTNLLVPGNSVVDSLLPAIEARHRALATDPSTAPAASAMRTLYYRMNDSKAGRDLLTTWARAGGAAEARVLLERIRNELNRLPRVPRVVEFEGALIETDDAGLADVVRAWRPAPENENDRELLQAAGDLVRLHVRDPSPWRTLALDPEQPTPARLLAIALIANAADEAVGRALVAIASAIPRSDPLASLPQDFVQPLCDSLPQPVKLIVFRGLLASRSAPDGWTIGFTYRLLPSLELTDSLVDEFLQRWPDSPSIDALRQVALRPPDRRGPWLGRALHRVDSHLQFIPMLGDLHDPTLRPLLVEALHPTWAGDLATHVQLAAIQALTRYYDDESVEILLGAVSSMPTEDLRKACFAALDQIRQYQDERARWSTRKNGQASRDAAIQKLLPSLGDRDATIRAQAALSLATLGAVEELPRILELLRDSDANVRRAAQRALDVLNAPAPK